MCQRDPTGNGEFVRNKMNLPKRLPPFDSKSGTLNIVIDTPKGCRSKFAYDMKRKAYVLKSVLAQGALFPFDFGSISGTVADDGDPLGALVLMDERLFVVVSSNRASSALSKPNRARTVKLSATIG